jgi:gas vesicle protein
MAKNKGKLALGGVILAGVGYLAGILTAPKSGKETRQDIQKSVTKAKLEAEKKLKQLHSELGDLIDSGKKTAGGLQAKAKKEAHKAVELGQTARDKAKAVLSAIHEGESDDDELNAAVQEATKAVSNLKKFVKKSGGGRGKNA